MFPSAVMSPVACKFAFTNNPSASTEPTPLGRSSKFLLAVFVLIKLLLILISGVFNVDGTTTLRVGAKYMFPTVGVIFPLGVTFKLPESNDVVAIRLDDLNDPATCKS